MLARERFGKRLAGLKFRNKKGRGGEPGEGTNAISIDRKSLWPDIRSKKKRRVKC